MIRCRCCGVVVEGQRAAFRRCPVCDICDRRHGDEREAVARNLVATGHITMWHGIASMAVDDAHLTGRLVFVGDPRAAGMRVVDPPPRWLVVAARAAALERQPSADDLVRAVVERYLPGPRSAIPELRAELREALTWMDPDVVDVQVEIVTDPEDIGSLRITAAVRTTPGSVVAGAGDVQVPAYVARMPRGQA